MNAGALPGPTPYRSLPALYTPHRAHAAGRQDRRDVALLHQPCVPSSVTVVIQLMEPAGAGAARLLHHFRGALMH